MSFINHACTRTVLPERPLSREDKDTAMKRWVILSFWTFILIGLAAWAALSAYYGKPLSGPVGALICIIAYLATSPAANSGNSS
jgi:hypothetical protein